MNYNISNFIFKISYEKKNKKVSRKKKIKTTVQFTQALKERLFGKTNLEHILSININHNLFD